MRSTNRETYLDWLRIFAILGVLFFHAAMPFVAEEPWHIKNTQTSNLLLEFNFWLSRFRMPLLFFISGIVTYFMLRRRTVAAFIGLRFRRLFIPLIAGMLLLIPVQVYVERLTTGYKGNFLSFLPTIFTSGVYPKGNLSWHHLWFIAYLFVYDIMLAPVLKWSMTVSAQKKTGFLHALARGRKVYLLMLPSVLAFSAMTLKFPETHDMIHDWSQHIYWILFLLSGFVCISFPSLLDSLERNRKFSLTIGFIMMVSVNVIRWNDLAPWDRLPAWQSDWRTYLYLALLACTAWFWVFAVVGYGKRYLNGPHPFMSYINNAVYPFYILHQTVIVVLAYYVVKTTDTILMKYAFIVILTLILSMAVYHLLIRPYRIMRFLFGGKQPVRSGGEKKEHQAVKNMRAELLTS